MPAPGGALSDSAGRPGPLCRSGPQQPRESYGRYAEGSRRTGRQRQDEQEEKTDGDKGEGGGEQLHGAGPQRAPPGHGVAVQRVPAAGLVSLAGHPVAGEPVELLTLHGVLKKGVVADVLVAGLPPDDPDALGIHLLKPVQDAGLEQPDRRLGGRPEQGGYQAPDTGIGAGPADQPDQRADGAAGQVGASTR